MKFWFEYVQNNSGGHFNEPAIFVFVHAKNEDIANKIAFSSGVYFNGCDDGVDCSCCGDRWNSPFNCGELMPEIDLDSFYLKCARESNIPFAIFLDDTGEIKRIES